MEGLKNEGPAYNIQVMKSGLKYKRDFVTVKELVTEQLR